MFNVYLSDKFIDIICKVYSFQKVEQLSDIGEFQFLRSSYPLRNKTFLLPISFWCPNKRAETILSTHWDELGEYSRITGSEVFIATLNYVDNGFSTHIGDNPILELNDGCETLEIYSKNHRQNIRTERNKAKREQIRIYYSNDLSDLKAFFHVMAIQYTKRHKMLFQPLRLFEELIRCGIGKLLVAKVCGKIVGGGIFIADGETLHYKWGARGYYKNVNPSVLLTDHVIRDAYSNGFRYFDFGGTALSHVGLLDFKLRWGTQNHKVYKYSTVGESQVTNLNSSFLTARKLYSKTPVWLTKRIMPKLVPWLI